MLINFITEYRMSYNYQNITYKTSYNIRTFAESYPDINRTAIAAQIPWGHNMIVLRKKMLI